VALEPPPLSPLPVSLDDKQFATLAARSALAGYGLLRDAPCGFVIARWGQIRWLPDVAAVEDFLARVGAKT
jgi:hypothetical protein